MIFSVKSAFAPLFIDDERVDEVLHGMSVKAEEENGEYLRILTAYRYSGWLHRSHLCAVTERSGETKYINTAAADVLAAPKVQAALLICLTLGCTVQTLASNKNGWTHVRLADGRCGYIRSSFLSDFPKEVTRKALVKAAMLYQGAQYRWGGKTPMGIDCSGMVFMAYWLNGVAIYRDARISPGFPIKKIPADAAREGDLLFFPGHVGILFDKDTMLHSSEAGNGVKLESLTDEWQSRITAAGSIF